MLLWPGDAFVTANLARLKLLCLKSKPPALLAIAQLSVATLLSVAAADVALAYVGNSYLQIPDIDGSWQGKPYKKWIKFEAHYWQGRQSGMGGLARRSTAFISGPSAPRQGAGTIVFSLDKRSADLPLLMERCAAKTPIPELTYAESSERARSSFEIGPRPAGFPEYFEYHLKDVLFSDCPTVEDAPEQAFIVTFKDIEWLNYGRDKSGAENKSNMAEIKLEPAPLKPAMTTGKSKTFVLTWFAAAHDVRDDQCPTMNAKPLESDYYALMSKEDADKERAELASKGGVNYENGQMGLRGPRKLNVTLVPGIVKDPGPRHTADRSGAWHQSRWRRWQGSAAARHVQAQELRLGRRSHRHRQPAVHGAGMYSGIPGSQGLRATVRQQPDARRADVDSGHHQRNRQRTERRQSRCNRCLQP